MSDDYKKGYREGFRDGFEAAKKKVQAPAQITDIVSSCPKCGAKFKGPMGYVCGRSDCPNFQVTCL
jgi:hypothetical protein